MDKNIINAFMKRLKTATMETGVAIEWTEGGIRLIDVQKQLDDGMYTWVEPDGVGEAVDVMWEYEGENYDG